MKTNKILLSFVLLVIIFLFIKFPDRASLIHNSIIYQNITRSAFFYNNKIFFSTLESYNRSIFEKDKSLLISHNLVDQNTTKSELFNSIEIRTYAFSKKHKFILGLSLDPQIILFDPDKNVFKKIFQGPTSGMWIHQMAIHNDNIYFIQSTIASIAKKYQGIVKIDLKNNHEEIIKFTTPHPEGYGGVETIDSYGRIWFWRAYPLKLFWYKNGEGFSERKIINSDGWRVASWDTYNNEFYYLLFDENGNFKKTKALTTSMVKSDSLYNRLIPIDFYHSQENFDKYYIDYFSNELYLKELNSFRHLGKFDIGKLILMCNQKNPMPQSTPLVWYNNNLGEVEILNIQNDTILFWARGKKMYGQYFIKKNQLKTFNINVQNSSAATITSLVTDNKGVLYGGGYLTMSDMFKYDPTLKSDSIYKSVVPNSEGQINSLFLGLDSCIYGTSYPNAVLFRYDPDKEWNPGESRYNNPVNFGITPFYNQMRSFKGLQALDSSIWYESVSDYNFPKAHALNKADFAKFSLISKNNIDNDFPIVKDLQIYDKNNLILYGEKFGKFFLYLLDQKEFKIIDSIKIDNIKNGILCNLLPQEKTPNFLYLINNKDLYKIKSDLSLQLIYKSNFKTLKWLKGQDENELLLIGRFHITKLNLTNNLSYTYFPTLFSKNIYLFKDISWLAASYHKKSNSIYFANDNQLWNFCLN